MSISPNATYVNNCMLEIMYVIEIFLFFIRYVFEYKQVMQNMIYYISLVIRGLHTNSVDRHKFVPK